MYSVGVNQIPKMVADSIREIILAIKLLFHYSTNYRFSNNTKSDLHK